MSSSCGFLFLKKIMFDSFNATSLFPYILKTTCVVLLSGGIERSHWHEMGYGNWKTLL